MHLELGKSMSRKLMYLGFWLVMFAGTVGIQCLRNHRLNHVKAWCDLDVRTEDSEIGEQVDHAIALRRQALRSCGTLTFKDSSNQDVNLEILFAVSAAMSGKYDGH